MSATGGSKSLGGLPSSDYPEIGSIGHFFYYMGYFLWQGKNREGFYSAFKFCPQGRWSLDYPSFVIYEGVES